MRPGRMVYAGLEISSRKSSDSATHSTKPVHSASVPKTGYARIATTAAITARLRPFAVESELLILRPRRWKNARMLRLDWQLVRQYFSARRGRFGAWSGPDAHTGDRAPGARAAPLLPV